jgi:CxxC-x17-CxxC domain-containing protein
MGRFNRDSRSGERGSGNRFEGGGFGGGRREFGGRKSFGDRDSGRSEMFMTVCDECGKDCEVPFKPTQGKPVYCSACFEDRGNDRRDFSNPRPSPDFRRPESRDFGRDNREPRESKGGNDNGKLLEQFSSLNSKLDRILKALESKNESTTAAKVESVAKKAEPKAEKKEKVVEKAVVAKEAKPKKAAAKKTPAKKAKK